MKISLLKWIAKAGYAARGIVYFIVGGFAVVAALGQGGGTKDTKGALLKLFETGFGTLLLAAIGIGLFCYSLWRLFQGITDADDHGTDLKGLVVRGGLLVSAATHIALAAWVLTAAFGGGGQSGDGKDDLAAWLIQQPFGPWLVVVVGLCICGAAFAHFFKGVTKGYEKWFDADERQMKVIRPISTLGLIARGVVFLIIGGLFIYAGITVDPQKAGGLREALQWTRGLPFGLLLFLVIAVGLTCFGAYSMIEAHWRRIKATEGRPEYAGRIA